MSQRSGIAPALFLSALVFFLLPPACIAAEDLPGEEGIQYSVKPLSELSEESPLRIEAMRGSRWAIQFASKPLLLDYYGSRKSVDLAVTNGKGDARTAKVAVIFGNLASPDTYKTKPVPITFPAGVSALRVTFDENALSFLFARNIKLVRVLLKKGGAQVAKDDAIIDWEYRVDLHVQPACVQTSTRQQFRVTVIRGVPPFTGILDYGDGESAFFTGYGSQYELEHTFAAAGNWPATLQIIDDLGGIASDSDTGRTIDSFDPPQIQVEFDPWTYPIWAHFTITHQGSCGPVKAVLTWDSGYQEQFYSYSWHPIQFNRQFTSPEPKHRWFDLLLTDQETSMTTTAHFEFDLPDPSPGEHR